MFSRQTLDTLDDPTSSPPTEDEEVQPEMEEYHVEEPEVGVGNEEEMVEEEEEDEDVDEEEGVGESGDDDNDGDSGRNSSQTLVPGSIASFDTSSIVNTEGKFSR